MIVYIDQPIKWNVTGDTKELFDEMGIEYSENSIKSQRLVLDEWDVNILFSDVFTNDVKIEYGFYGGEGCDFSIDISEKQPEYLEYQAAMG